MPQQSSTEPKFPLGKLVATPGAIQAMTEAKQSPLEFLARHVTGDWGDVPEEDKAANDADVEAGGQAPVGVPADHEGQALDHHRGRPLGDDHPLARGVLTMPFHKHRTWVVHPAESVEWLAEKLMNHSWCNCQGWSLGGYLFLNDQTSPDGAFEVAIVKPPGEPDGPWWQVESITFGWIQSVPFGETALQKAEPVHPGGHRGPV